MKVLIDYSLFFLILMVILFFLNLIVNEFFSKRKEASNSILIKTMIQGVVISAISLPIMLAQ